VPPFPRSFPCFNTLMGRLNKMIPVMLLLCTLLVAQSPNSRTPVTRPAEDYSGMYSFLQDGEFVQLTIEDAGRVTGFVSRYGDLESDHGEFLDHFFKPGTLDGKKLSFSTETVHGVWYEFRGIIERGPGKSPGDEAYYLLKGTLTQHTTDANKKTSSKSREVAFKSFPQDMDAAPAKQN
jgi:hypothetical protein